MPLVAVTMGDPSGIGPEIVLKTLIRNPELREQVIAVGSSRALKNAAESMHLEKIPDDIKIRNVDGQISPMGKSGPVDITTRSIMYRTIPKYMVRRCFTVKNFLPAIRRIMPTAAKPSDSMFVYLLS